MFFRHAAQDYSIFIYGIRNSVSLCYLMFLIELCAGHAKSWLEWEGIQTIHNQWFVKVIVTWNFNNFLVIFLFIQCTKINDVLFFFTDKEETRYAKLLLASKEDVLKQVITKLSFYFCLSLVCQVLICLYLLSRSWKLYFILVSLTTAVPFVSRVPGLDKLGRDKTPAQTRKN